MKTSSSSFRARASRLGGNRQQGAIIVFAAMAVSLVVILISIADIGFLYYYKREYQKAADLAAMAGARKLVSRETGFRSCGSGARPAAEQAAARNLGSVAYLFEIECGKWSPRDADRLDTTADAQTFDAVRVRISGTPPRFLPYIDAVTLSATATALADQPLAQLTMRSTTAAIDTTQSGLLNAVVGGLLGGSISLPVAAWNGLLNTDINLLNYMDALALRLGLDVGNYEQVLGTQVTVGELLDVAAEVLSRGGGTGQLGVAAGGIEQLIGVNLPGLQPLVRLGDILDIRTGTAAAGLDTGLNVLDLVQASVQLASSECAVCATVPVNLPGVAGVNVRVKVMEPPRLSSIGNPELASADPLGPDRIYVRSSQVRSLVSVDLPIAGSVLSAIANLLNNSVVSGITNAVNDLLSLNLLGLLQSLSCVVYCDIQRDLIDILVLPTPRLDLALDAGSGEAYVDDYSCEADGKSLRAQTNTATAHLRIGKMGNSAAQAAANVFSSSAAPVVDPVALLDIGTRRVRYQCTLLLICWTEWRAPNGSWLPNSQKAQSARVAFAGGGIGLKADVPIAGMSTAELYENPPTGGLPVLGQPPAWKTVTSSGVVSRLNSELSGLQLQFYRPVGGALGGQGLGNVIHVVGSVVNTLVSEVLRVVSGVLGPVLDPLLDLLLDTLGVDLNRIEVGGNLSCEGGGATLID